MRRRGYGPPRGAKRYERGLSSRERKRQAKQLERFRRNEERRRDHGNVKLDELRDPPKSLDVVHVQRHIKKSEAFREMISQLLAERRLAEQERLVVVHVDGATQRELAFALKYLREAGFTRIFLV